jgi:hypothetical protein
MHNGFERFAKWFAILYCSPGCSADYGCVHSFVDLFTNPFCTRDEGIPERSCPALYKSDGGVWLRQLCAKFFDCRPEFFYLLRLRLLLFVRWPPPPNRIPWVRLLSGGTITSING